MTKNSRFFLNLASAISEELDNIDKLNEEIRTIPDDAPFSGRAKGSVLHDFYNCCERIFKKIAVEINGGMPETDMWHKDLLYKMTKPVHGLRPRVISEGLAAELDDYLSFRHIFRNIYGFELKGERLKRLADNLYTVSERLKKEVEEFLEKVKGEK